MRGLASKAKIWYDLAVRTVTREKGVGIRTNGLDDIRFTIDVRELMSVDI